MTKFTRIPAPPTASGLLQFPEGVQDRVEKDIRQAEQTGAWLAGDEVAIDLKDPNFWSYWIYKTIHPVEKPRSSDLLHAAFGIGVQSSAQLHPVVPAQAVRLRLSLAGDLMAGAGIAHSRDALFRQVSDLLFGAEIAYANLESTRTTQDIPALKLSLEEAPVISASHEEYLALSRHGERRFDVLQLANNHILDFGAEGVACTLAALKEDGIAQVGVNETEKEAGRAKITHLHGLKIGWVAHTFSVNFKPFPPDAPWIVNMTPFHLELNPDTRAIEAEIRRCRSDGCDLVIVSLHWGLEFELFPHPQQVEWARRFAEAGADLVVGHHPHVAQPMEIYLTSTGVPRKVPILYSLGNLTGILSHPASVLSLVAKVDVFKAGGVACIAGLQLVPVVQLCNPSERVLQILPLAAIATGEFQIDEPGYAAELCRYADLVIGTGWRRDSARSK